MPYNVTSWFIEQARTENPPVKRTFTIGNSDYSSYVLKWPVISRRWDDLRPVNVTIDLSNEDQTFNFFRSDKTKLRATCEVKIGFTHPTSGDELISVFRGTSEKVNFIEGKVALSIADKLKPFSERVVGLSNSPIVFSASNLLASDIAWTLCTCYGAFSSIQSTSNPDIDYASWQAWAAIFSADTVLMRARYDGQKVTECLRKLANMTQSAIVLSNDKLTFNRFTTVNTNASSLDNRHILGLSVGVDDADMVNKQWVYADYRPESNYWSISVFDTRTASVNSFGLREQIAQDESIWYVNSANALNLAQRVMSTAGVPYDRINVETPLVPVHHLIGETVAVLDTQLDITEGWRVMGYRLDTDAGRISLSVDASQINTPFILDVSALDGADVLL